MAWFTAASFFTVGLVLTMEVRMEVHVDLCLGMLAGLVEPSWAMLNHAK